MAHANPRVDPINWPTEYTVVAVALGVESLLTLVHFFGTPGTVTRPRYVLYSFVWINAVLWAAVRVDQPTAPRRHRAAAALVAAAYFLLLANWGGLLGLVGLGHHPPSEFSLGLSVAPVSPTMVEVTYTTPELFVRFVPYLVVGYFGLAYLVYVAILDVTGAVVTGAVGLLSCLSCSFPIFASLATGVFGGYVSLTSTVFAYSFDLSTVAFLVSVGLLYWRPGFPSLAFGGSRPGTESAGGDEDAPETE